jgi:putative ABC transport system ATP-binding protein
LCDEPTGALDAETGRLVLKTLVDVNREVGTATAIITHNAVIAGIADRVLRMASGRLSEAQRNPRRVSVDELVW